MSEGARTRRRLQARLFLPAEALLRDFVGFTLGLFVMFAALVLDPLACLGRFTLGALDCIALLADFRLFLGDLAFLGLAYLRIAERVGAPDRKTSCRERV